MSGRIEIWFEKAEGAVIRMLGLVERRGFDLRGVVMAETGERARLVVDVEPRGSGRSLDVLSAQLRRLIEVRSVSCSSIPDGVSA